jgi:hypothetical protein
MQSSNTCQCQFFRISTQCHCQQSSPCTIPKAKPETGTWVPKHAEENYMLIQKEMDDFDDFDLI